MVLKAIPGEFSVCSLTGMEGVSLEDEFCFLSRTDEELSLVCRSEVVPAGARKVESGWRMFRVEGVLDFSLTGILSRLSSALAEARIGIFAVSTFNTDYILVRSADFDRAREALRRIGCEWRDEK